MCEIVVFFLMIRRPPRSTPLSLHDALPIWRHAHGSDDGGLPPVTLADTVEEAVRGADVVMTLRLQAERQQSGLLPRDRKSTRLNSSHANISYAVFCLNKKTDIPTKILATDS